MGRWGRGALMLGLVLTGWALMAAVLPSLLSPMGALLAGLFAGGFWLAGVVGLFSGDPSREEVEGEEP